MTKKWYSFPSDISTATRICARFVFADFFKHTSINMNFSRGKREIKLTNSGSIGGTIDFPEKYLVSPALRHRCTITSGSFRGHELLYLVITFAEDEWQQSHSVYKCCRRVLVTLDEIFRRIFGRPVGTRPQSCGI